MVRIKPFHLLAELSHFRSIQQIRQRTLSVLKDHWIHDISTHGASPRREIDLSRVILQIHAIFRNQQPAATVAELPSGT